MTKHILTSPGPASRCPAGPRAPCRCMFRWFQPESKTTSRVWRSGFSTSSCRGRKTGATQVHPQANCETMGLSGYVRVYPAAAQPTGSAVAGLDRKKTRCCLPSLHPILEGAHDRAYAATGAQTWTVKGHVGTRTNMSRIASIRREQQEQVSKRRNENLPFNPKPLTFSLGTGPPQHGKKGLMAPGAFSASSSSIFFLACAWLL